MKLTPIQIKKLIGKKVYAVKRDGTRLSGKLVRVKGQQVYIRPSANGKQVRTSAVIPLVLFDLLAIGTGPYGYPYGPISPYGPGPYSPYGGYPGFYGYPGFL